MNCSARRPEMRLEVQGLGGLDPEGFWITCSASFLLFPAWQIHSSFERSRSLSMLCLTNWPHNFAFRLPSCLDTVRSVRLIFVNWNTLSRTGGASNIATFSPRSSWGASAWPGCSHVQTPLFPGCTGGSWAWFAKTKYLKSEMVPQNFPASCHFFQGASFPYLAQRIVPPLLPAQAKSGPGVSRNGDCMWKPHALPDHCSHSKPVFLSHCTSLLLLCPLYPLLGRMGYKNTPVMRILSGEVGLFYVFVWKKEVACWWRLFFFPSLSCYLVFLWSPSF